MKRAKSGMFSLVATIAIAWSTWAITAEPLSAAEPEETSEPKPLLVMMFDQNCKTWCAQVRPLVADLRKDYGDRVEFAEIDVTRSALPQAKQKAAKLRIGNLIEDSVDYVPLVLICSASRKDHWEFVGAKTKEAYVKRLEKVLEKEK